MFGTSGSKQPEKRSQQGNPRTLESESAQKCRETQMHVTAAASVMGNTNNTSGGQQSLVFSLIRRPLRANSNEDVSVPRQESAQPIHIPLLVPKQEKQDSHRSRPILPITRDPRQTKEPIIEHPDCTSDILSNEPVPQSILPDQEAPLVDVFHSDIEITTHHLKHEMIDSDSDWKTSYLKENACLEEPIDTPPIRIKTEPIDDDPNFVNIEDDDCSNDSGSTVGLPSPPRSPSSRLNGLNLRNDAPGSQNMSTMSSTHILPSPESMPESDSNTSKKKSAYSEVMDVADVYKRLEQESLQVTSKQGYSQDSSDESESDEIIAELNEDIEENQMNTDSDGLSDEEFSSWVSPVPPVDERQAQKRRLDNNDGSSATEDEQPVASKKNKFTVVKNPQFYAVSSPSTSVGAKSSSMASASTNATVESAPSTSTASLQIATNSESSAPQSTQEVDKDPLRDPSNRSEVPSRPKIPVKLTEKNRNTRMLEDFLKSIHATPVLKKRTIAPSKPLQKRKTHPNDDVSVPPSTASTSMSNCESSLAGIQSSEEPVAGRKQSTTSCSALAVRDPRLRAKHKEETQLVSHSKSFLLRRSDLIFQRSRELKNNILLRVFKWQFKWIEESRLRNEPPPLLQALKINNLELPALSCDLVRTTYPNLQLYFSIFHPLLMHEMWSSLCFQNRFERKERKLVDYKVLIKSSTREEYFCILECQILIEEEQEAPQVNDLIVISFTRWDGGNTLPFCLVERSTTTKIVRTANLDQRLLVHGRSKFLVELSIRLLNNYAPKQNNFIASASKVASLATAMTLFDAQIAFIMSPLLSVVLNPLLSAFQMMSCSSIMMNNLDPDQSKACLSIAQTMLITPKNESKVAILQGYPGTGKTHVNVFIIRHLVGHKQGETRHRILYCAPTNAAVDEMTLRLLNLNKNSHPNDNFTVLRMGFWERLHPEVREFTLEEKLARVDGKIKLENPNRKQVKTLLEKLTALEISKQSINEEIDSEEPFQAEYSEKSKELAEKLSQVSEEIEVLQGLLETTKQAQAEQIKADIENFKLQLISEADVICTTLEACYTSDMKKIFIDQHFNRDGKNTRPFLCCIIDDASLCTEPQTLIPLTLGMNKLILVGDVELLPLNLYSALAKSQRLDQSLFTRFQCYLKLNQGDNVILNLTKQHRMDSEICKWTSKYYYGNRLVTSEDLTFRTPLHSYRILDVRDSVETPELSSYINVAEAEVIVKIVGSIFDSPSMNERHIGVITFYEKQRLYIRTAIKQRFPKHYTRTDVKLVQDFQGSETDIVIISFVRSKGSKDKNFNTLTDHLNVALTRATESLYICGNLKFLQTIEVLDDLVRDAEKRQVIRRVSSLFDESLLYDMLLKPIDF